MTQTLALKVRGENEDKWALARQYSDCLKREDMSVFPHLGFIQATWHATAVSRTLSFQAAVCTFCDQATCLSIGIFYLP